MGVRLRGALTLILGCLLCGSSGSWAGTVGLQLGAITRASDDLIILEVSLVNTGDEPAFEVNPVVWIEETPQRLPGARKLIPHNELKMTYTSLQHPFQQQGVYYLPIHISYRDALGSRFKLAYLLNLVRGNGTEARLALTAGNMTLPADKEVEITLKNLDQTPKQVHLTQITSMGIDLDLPTSPLSLGANEEKSWLVKVTHGTLLPNTYPNYVIASYSLDDRHYSGFIAIETTVTTVPDIRSEIFTRKNMTWALLALIMITLIGGYGPGVVQKLWQKRS